MHPVEQAKNSYARDANIVQAILMVDDNEDSLVALSALLERPGVNLLRARSGPEALNLLLTESVALVLLDVQMPGMDGFEVARLMQGRLDTRNIPILFMTAFYRDEAALLRGYRNGAIDYLYKPINPAVLKPKVELFLEMDRQRRCLENAYGLIEEQKRYYQSILQAVGDGVLGIDGGGFVRFCNPAALAIFHCEATRLLGRAVESLFASGTARYIDQAMHGVTYPASEYGELRYEEDVFQRDDGSLFPVSLRRTPVDGSLHGYVLAFQDISERKCFEERLVAQTMTDPLTGLANRNGLKAAVEMTLGRARRGGALAGLLLIDLDHFKDVNDTYGHEIGDAFLREVARRLRECVRINDTVARLGGDEFTIVLDELGEADDAAGIAEKILEVLGHPYAIGGVVIGTGASIGIAIYPDCGVDTGELMRSADIAMYRAKGEGRNGFQFYTQEMNAKVKVRLMLEQSLRCALENRELFLAFQPLVRLEDGVPIGFEALLRWSHPEAGIVPPDTFIPLLEECGLIIQVGGWVIDQVCQHIHAWRREGLLPEGFRVSLNVSPRQFASSHFVPQLLGAMARWSVAGRDLDLELTESILMKDIELARERIGELKAHDLSFSIDDFGTGYSSLNYLKQFVIDRLKIDKCFVQQIVDSDKDAAICRTIITLAHSLKLSVVAEGIETEAQCQALKAMGCDLGQGFCFERPMPLEQASDYLRRPGKPSGADSE